MPVVEVDNLRYRYPGRETLALDGISFAAESGQFLGVVGPNSSGKSTLCHALVGLVPHFYKGAIGGRVIVAGEDVHKTTVAEMSRRVGLVFQNPFTQMTGGKLTVYEEAAFGLEYTGVPRDEMMVRIEKALRLLGLWEVRDRSPFALSGGQMQRLAIASVLAMEPDVLVLDEPTSQLDPSGTREVFDAVAALCRQGMTVIMAEHKIELLAAHADRILVLHEGKLVTDDTPRNVFPRLARWAVAAPGAQHAPDSGTGRGNRRRRTGTDGARRLGRRRPAARHRGGRGLGLDHARGRLPRHAGGRDHHRARATVAHGRRRPRTASSEPDHDGGGHAAATEAAPVIQVRDVRFHYTPGVPVLKGITLDIGPGATAVIGQNGAGKSTFVRMLNGLLKPTAGDVLVNGVNTRTATVATLARTVGLVFQNPSDQLFKSRVIDEVMFGPMNLGVPAGEAEDRARAALAQVGLSGVETRNPYDLGLAERKVGDHRQRPLHGHGRHHPGRAYHRARPRRRPAAGRAGGFFGRCGTHRPHHYTRHGLRRPPLPAGARLRGRPSFGRRRRRHGIFPSRRIATSRPGGAPNHPPRSRLGAARDRPDGGAVRPAGASSPIPSYGLQRAVSRKSSATRQPAMDAGHGYFNEAEWKLGVKIEV